MLGGIISPAHCRSVPRSGSADTGECTRSRSGFGSSLSLPFPSADEKVGSMSQKNVFRCSAVVSRSSTQGEKDLTDEPKRVRIAAASVGGTFSPLASPGTALRQARGGGVPQAERVDPVRISDAWGRVVAAAKQIADYVLGSILVDRVPELQGQQQS